MHLSFKKKEVKILHGTLELFFLAFPILLFYAWVQHIFYTKSLFYVSIPRAIGLLNFEAFSLTDFAQFYSTFLLEGFIILPILLAGGILILGKKNSKIILFILSFILTTVCFFTWVSMANVGQFLTVDTIYSTINWGIEDPQIIGSYVSYKMGFAYVSIAVSPFFINWILRRLGYEFKNNRIRFVPHAVSLTIIGLASIFFLMSFSSNISNSYDRMSLFSRIFENLIVSDKMEYILDYNSEQELTALNQYSERTKVSITGNNILTGITPRKQNVIFFIIETGPAQIYEMAVDKGLKHFNEIRSNSIIATNHYTAFPYTSEGLFSIFASIYPEGNRRRLIDSKVNVEDIGMFNQLKETGFETSVHTINRFPAEQDDYMFDLLGLKDRFYVADMDSERQHKSSQNIFFEEEMQQLLSNLFPNAEGLPQKISRDNIALDNMFSYIDAQQKNNKNFASVFLPTIGHGPWPNINRSKDDLFESGIAIAKLHDHWLGIILKKIEDLGIKDSTMIVITSDHGLRTKTEYPEIVSERLNDMTYRVPLIVYSPASIDKQITIEQPTSHVDIAPTVLELMNEKTTICSMGRAVWQKDSREVFLEGKYYFSTIGKINKNKIVSYNYLTQTLYSGSNFESLSEIRDKSKYRNDLIILDQHRKFQRQFSNATINDKKCPIYH